MILTILEMHWKSLQNKKISNFMRQWRTLHCEKRGAQSDGKTACFTVQSEGRIKIAPTGRLEELFYT